MSWLWGSKEKESNGDAGQKASTAKAAKDEPTGFASFVSSLEKKAETIGTPRDATLEKKSTFNFDKSTPKTSTGLKTEPFSFDKSPLEKKSTFTSSIGSDRPTLRNSESEPPKKFSFSFKDPPAQTTFGKESKKVPVFTPPPKGRSSSALAREAKPSSVSSRSSFLDEKPGSPAGFGLDAYKRPDFTSAATDTWSTSMGTSRSVGSFAPPPVNISSTTEVEDEARLQRWETAVEQVDRQQNEVMQFQSRLFREQINTISNDAIQMRIDIAELFTRHGEHFELSESMRVSLLELEDKLLEEVRKQISAIAGQVEADKAERVAALTKLNGDYDVLKVQLSAEETARKSECKSLDEEMKRLRKQLEDDAGKSTSAKEETRSVTVRIRENETSIKELYGKLQSRLDSESKARKESESKHIEILEEKFTKLQKTMDAYPSKAEFTSLKSELERETKQRTKAVEALEEGFLSKSEFKALKAELEREGKTVASTTRELSSIRSEMQGKLVAKSDDIVGKDALSKIRAEFEQKIETLAANLEQALAQGAADNSLRSEFVETKIVEERTKSSFKEALSVEINARKGLEAGVLGNFQDLERELKSLIDTNRKELEVTRHDLRKVPIETLTNQLKDLERRLESEVASRQSKNQYHANEIRSLVEALSNTQTEQGKEMERGFKAIRESLKQEQVGHKDEVRQLIALVEGKLDDERLLRKKALEDIYTQIAHNSEQIALANASVVDKHDDTLKRWAEFTKRFEGEQRQRMDEQTKVRQANEGKQADFEKTMKHIKDTHQEEHGKVVMQVKNLVEKMENVVSENKRNISEIQDKIKSESKERAAGIVEKERQIEQAKRAAEEEGKKRQKEKQELIKQLEQVEKESRKALEGAVRENSKRLDALETSIDSGLKKAADDRASQMRDMKDMVKGAQSEQNERLTAVSKEISAKVQGVQQDSQNRLADFRRDSDAKVEKAGSQYMSKLMGVSKDLTSQFQDMLTQEKRSREKGLKELQDRYNNSELEERRARTR